MPNPIVKSRALRPRPPIFDRMVAYWPLCEPSGDRVDLISKNTLTDNNTVTQADGLIGKAGLFTRANSEDLSIADNPVVSLGANGNDKFSFTAWVLFNTLPSTTVFQQIAGKNGAGGDFEFDIIAADSGGVQMFIELNPSGGYQIIGQAFPGGISTGVWYFVHGFADGANVGVSLNAQAPSTIAYTGTLGDGTTSFRLGSQSGSTHYLDGRLQLVSLHKGRVLTARELDWLYNAGRGRDLSVYLR